MWHDAGSPEAGELSQRVRHSANKLTLAEISESLSPDRIRHGVIHEDRTIEEVAHHPSLADQCRICRGIASGRLETIAPPMVELDQFEPESDDRGW